jgi:hypothetical protein
VSWQKPLRWGRCWWLVSVTLGLVGSLSAGWVRAAHGDAWQVLGVAGVAEFPGVRVMATGLAHPQWNNGDVDEPDGAVASVESKIRQAWSMRRRCGRVPALRSSFAGFRFPPDVITIAVRWYLRYALSYRDVEELLAERNIEVDHVTIYRWVQRFTPLLIDAARPCRHCPGDRWFVDETYMKVAGRWVYMYRAIDQFG